MTDIPSKLHTELNSRDSACGTKFCLLTNGISVARKDTKDGRCYCCHRSYSAHREPLPIYLLQLLLTDILLSFALCCSSVYNSTIYNCFTCLVIYNFNQNKTFSSTLAAKNNHQLTIWEILFEDGQPMMHVYGCRLGKCLTKTTLLQQPHYNYYDLFLLICLIFSFSSHWQPLHTYNYHVKERKVLINLSHILPFFRFYLVVFFLLVISRESFQRYFDISKYVSQLLPRAVCGWPLASPAPRRVTTNTYIASRTRAHWGR